jgi:hypothetical protein
MSRAEPLGAGLPNDASTTKAGAGGLGHKRRNLSLANISIPSLSNLSTSILKRKPLPANSPVTAAQRALSVDSPRPFVPRPQNLLTPIPSPGQPQFAVRDLDQYVHSINSRHQWSLIANRKLN